GWVVKPEGERRTLSVLARDQEIAIHEPREAAADREPESGSVLRARVPLLDRHERSEDRAELFARDATTGVRYREADPRPRAGQLRVGRAMIRHDTLDVHPAARRGELDGVVEEVHENLTHAILVAFERHLAVCRVRRGQGAVVPRSDRKYERERAFDHAPRVADALMQRESSGLDAREVEHFVD